MINEDGAVTWNPAYRVEILEDKTLFLYSELTKKILKGSIFCLLAPFLSIGTYTADQIVDALQDKFSPDRIYFALLELEKAQLIQQNSKIFSGEIAAFCGLINVTEQEANTRIKTTAVYVEGEPELVSLLKDLRIQIVEDPNAADFSVICVHDYLQLNLDLFNRQKPWLLCKPYGTEIWIGPLFHPNRSGCYECLSFRLKINRLEETYLQQKLHLDHCSPPHAFLPTSLAYALNLTATEVFKYVISEKNELLEEKILTFNTINLKKQEHLLLKRPTCSYCGNSELSSQLSVLDLKSRKTVTTDGAVRCYSPEETVKKFAHLVSPITGVINYLEPVSKEMGSPIHVYNSGSNWAVFDLNSGSSLSSFRTFSGGKGTSEIAAKAGGLCEAIERSSGIFHGDEHYTLTSFDKLKDQAIHPNKVLLYSDHQYENCKFLNNKGHGFWKVAPLFSEKGCIPWSPLYSLTEKRVKYYPTSCCYYNVPKNVSSWEARADSNGCAAGNCLEEAILQGFFELVERDSVAIWWYNRLEYPKVDVQSFHSPYVESLLREYACKKREMWVLDITSDLGIPVFVALSRLLEGPEEQIYMGFGAHLNPEIAVMRAITEMNQFLETDSFWEKKIFSEGEQDLINKKIAADWMKYVRKDDNPYLRGQQVLKQAADFHTWDSVDLLDDINHCREIIENQGMEFLVLDQTRPEIALNVVRVVVPGLRHFWPRFAPGRLYDIPVKMGKLSTPLKESEMNPVGMFL